MLSYMDISDWKADQYNWTSEKNYYQLKIKGSYVDFLNKKILFNEIHFYYPHKTIQILHTRPSSIKNGEKYATEITDFLKKRILK